MYTPHKALNKPPLGHHLIRPQAAQRPQLCEPGWEQMTKLEQPFLFCNWHQRRLCARSFSLSSFYLKHSSLHRALSPVSPCSDNLHHASTADSAQSNWRNRFWYNRFLSSSLRHSFRGGGCKYNFRTSLQSSHILLPDYFHLFSRWSTPVSVFLFLAASLPASVPGSGWGP
jgi:hypothetical protein